MSSKVTVNGLYDQLSDLIADGYGDKIVKLSINYDHCDHIQNLKEVYSFKELNWVTLLGG